MTMSQPPQQPMGPQQQPMGQPQQYPAQQYPQAQPPKKKGGWAKMIILFGILGIAGCGAILSAIGGGEDATTAGPTASSALPADEPASDEPKEPAKPDAKIGEPVTDGELRFVVKSVKCGATRVGDEYFGAKAQGQFCLVKMNVKNISDASTTFDGDNQTLINKKGQEFSADTEAMFSVNDENQTFLEEINPAIRSLARSCSTSRRRVSPTSCCSRPVCLGSPRA
jgi:hypothetical protein